MADNELCGGVGERVELLVVARLATAYLAGLLVLVVCLAAIACLSCLLFVACRCQCRFQRPLVH